MMWKRNSPEPVLKIEAHNLVVSGLALNTGTWLKCPVLRIKVIIYHLC